MTDKVTISISVDPDVAEVLDALAFVWDFGGPSPRASLVRETMSDLARKQYDTDETVRELVDTRREVKHGKYRHLRVVP